MTRSRRATTALGANAHMAGQVSQIACCARFSRSVRRVASASEEAWLISVVTSGTM